MPSVLLRLAVTASIAIVAGSAFAQVAITPSSQSNGPNQTPIYHVTVVGRTTPAINYRPGGGETKVDLVGTAAMTASRGVAAVSGKKGYNEIDARFERMDPPSQFGREYLTFVLWAITPEGRAKNLGEVQTHDHQARVQVTTDLQAFAMVVTAEPYFAVTQPSDVVVMENAVPNDTDARVDTVNAKYELLTRGSYLRDQDASFSAAPLEPGVPLDLAEARNAIALARIAGADRYAAESFTKATRLLAEAEAARGSGRRARELTMAARQAAQTAEDARLIAVRRQEDAVNARQRVAAAVRERDALDRAQAEETRRLQAERETAAARATADRERLERERASTEAAQVHSDAEQAVAAADAARQAADADAQQARVEALRAQAAAAVAIQEKNDLRDRLRQQLNAFLETRESARGLIMNVPDVLFESGSATLTTTAREKLARVGGILAAQPELHITVEGHTDNVGDAQQNQRLSERRATSVLSYLVHEQVPLVAMDSAGFGETRPIAPNDTAQGRRENRRVEIIVAGEPIQRPSGASAQ